jgi:hypothetical protein
LFKRFISPEIKHKIKAFGTDGILVSQAKSGIQPIQVFFSPLSFDEQKLLKVTLIY